MGNLYASLVDPGKHGVVLIYFVAFIVILAVLTYYLVLGIHSKNVSTRTLSKRGSYGLAFYIFALFVLTGNEGEFNLWYPGFTTVAILSCYLAIYIGMYISPIPQANQELPGSKYMKTSYTPLLILIFSFLGGESLKVVKIIFGENYTSLDLFYSFINAANMAGIIVTLSFIYI